MIKELFLAITLGALLGFGITGGFLALNKNKPASTSVTPTPTIYDLQSTISPTPTPSPEETITSSQLIIDSPEDGSIVSSSKLKITGSSDPKDTIIITTPVKVYNLSSDDSGLFETTIDLESGANLVKITAIDANDNQSDAQILVTYSTAKL